MFLGDGLSPDPHTLYTRRVAAATAYTRVKSNRTAGLDSREVPSVQGIVLQGVETGRGHKEQKSNFTF
jgi:hypothetical protein